MLIIPFQTLLLSILALGANAAPSNDISNLEKRARHNVTSSNKAGLGWNNPQTTNMTQFFRTSKVGWYYTWSSWANDQGNNLDFVPLLWGKDDVSTWQTAITGRLKPLFQSQAITCVLGFNEPQETQESNLTPSQAKDLWMANILPLKTQYGVRLGSPATSSAPSGKNWTQQFLTLCGTECQVDFVALHYYGTNATTMINYITDFHNTFQKPIWVTEWACQDYTGANHQCSDQQVKDYMNKTQTFMESVDWVERYSWFGALVNNPITKTNDLISSSGYITSLGQQYIMETPEQIAQGNSSTISHLSTSTSASHSSSTTTTPAIHSAPLSTSLSGFSSNHTTDGADHLPTFSGGAPHGRTLPRLSGYLPPFFGNLYLLSIVLALTGILAVA